MYHCRHRSGVGFLPLLGLVIWGAAPSAALAVGATRDLSAYTGPGVAFTVSITLDPPPDPGLAALEDSPPAGWVAIANISDGGIYDAENHKVKFGPYIGGGQIPALVTYDITPPTDGSGPFCFSGSATYDEGNWNVAGDECLGPGVPTASRWGLIVMMLLVLAAATVVFVQRSPAQHQK